MRSSATPRIMVAMLAATSFIGAVHAQYCTSEELEYWCDGLLTNEVAKCLPLLYGNNACCDCSSGVRGFCSQQYCDISSYVRPSCDPAGGDTSTVGDSVCDPENNIGACAWDGGDCCECDCHLPASDSCGDNGYSCLNPDSECYGGGGADEAEPAPAPTPLVVSCMENDFIRSPAGVNAVFSVDGVWSLEDGDYARHETAVVVNEEYTTEGAFVEAAFYGEFSQGAAVSGSPITAVEFGVKVYDPAGNSEFCSFLLAIIPEEEEEDPAPAPVVPWWDPTAPTASTTSDSPNAPTITAWDPPVWSSPTAPSPVEPAPELATPEPEPEPTPEQATPEPTPSPVSPPQPTTPAPVIPDAANPAPTPSPQEPEPTPENARPTAAPVKTEEEPEVPAPSMPEEQEDSAEKGDDGSDSVDSGDNGYYVEAGTKTTVGVTATGFDERPGSDSGDVGCGEDGCLPELAHDGVGFENGDDVESRWSCAENIVLPGKKQCEIEFTFDAPQHIADVQVAFWKGDERARTLKVKINGEKVGVFESQAGSIVTSLGIEEDDVHSITLESVGLHKDEWISLLEVRFMVEP